MTRFLGRTLCVIFAVLAAACSDNTPVTTTPTPVALAVSPFTVTLRNNLYKGGAVSRIFTTTKSGTITLTVQSSEVPIGIGIGVPIGTTCQATVSAVAAVPEQVAVDAERGTYCAVVYDAGGIATVIPFTVELTYP